MAKFHDALASVFAEGYDGDATADLTAAYDEDVSVYDAKVGELTTSNDDLTASAAATVEAHTAEVNRLKAVNYDLMQSVPRDESAGEVITQDDAIVDAGLTFGDDFFVEDSND